MDINYTLHIGDFHVMPDTGEGNPENVVLLINYALIGTTQHKGVWYAHSYNDVIDVAPHNLDFSQIDKDTFIAFEDLTKEQVEQWIYDRVSPEKLAMMKSSIESKLIDETTLTIRSAPWIELNPVPQVYNDQLPPK